MNLYITTICILLLSAGAFADPIKDNNVVAANSGFNKCLEADSISCLQLTLFRKAKSFFENPQIEIIGGVSLIKSNEGRQGKSLDDNAVAVEAAPSVEARTSEMGTYLMTHAKNFFAERSLNFNFANAARSMARAIPDDIKADLRELVVESRTKKKKLLKKFLPILLGVGAKIAILGVGAIFGLLFLAKKALVVSVIAFFLALAAGASSGLSRLGGGGGGGGGLLGGLGGLFGGKNSGGSSGASSGGWSSGGGSGGWSSGGNSGWDSHGAYSSPVAQTIAYSGYKPARR
ncbi:keratin, type II cytoskeletal 5 [Anastrepha ludens]|uniref:keratin, type II cytoskeletal 5 n=1 Tax=Anastrepha ludens TaxID=28586 RepID=UPI0023B099EE|nr:keratin, type II cytoskeletal 5 [Anastrepha ludens]